MNAVYTYVFMILLIEMQTFYINDFNIYFDKRIGDIN